MDHIIGGFDAGGIGLEDRDRLRQRNRDAYDYIARCQYRRMCRNWLRLGCVDLVCLAIILADILMGVAT